MSQTKPRAIDRLKSADKYQLVYVDIDIPLNEEESIEARLNAPDIWTIKDEQELIFAKKLARCKREGLHHESVDQEELESELANIDRSTKEGEQQYKYALKNAPKNLAEQTADKMTKFATIKGILPRFLCDRETGEPLFRTEEEQQAFIEIIKQSMPLFTLLANAYTELSTKVYVEKEQVKNSKAPAPSQSGS